MKMKMFVLGLIVMSLAIITGCSDDATGNDSVEEQIVLVKIQDYYVPGSNTIPTISASVYADPIQEINYCRINDTTFDDPANFSYGIGNSYLKLTIDQLIGLNLDSSVDFEINSALGTVSGSITRPELISELRINGAELDTLSEFQAQVSATEDIVVSWTYQADKPDYLQIEAHYYWQDSVTGEYGSLELNESVANNQASLILIKGGEIQLDGEMYLIISSVNGPDTSNHEDSNLHGSGAGYINWIYTSELNDIMIQVGEGFKSKTGEENE